MRVLRGGMLSGALRRALPVRQGVQWQSQRPFQMQFQRQFQMQLQRQSQMQLQRQLQRQSQIQFQMQSQRQRFSAATDAAELSKYFCEEAKQQEDHFAWNPSQRTRTVRVRHWN